MNVQDQLANLARSIDSEQAPVTVEEIRHGDRTMIADVDRTEHRSRRGWMAAAAAVVVLLVGVGALVIWSGDDPSRIEPADTEPQPTPTTLPETPTTVDETPTTTATSEPEPTTSTPDAEAGWTGGLLGDIDETSLRPLDSFTDGDVIVPTAPSSWRVDESISSSPDDEWAERSSVTITEAQPFTHFATGQLINEGGPRIHLRLTRTPECAASPGCNPSGPPVTIGGLEWQLFAVESDPTYFAVRASVGDLWIWVTPEVVGFIADGTWEYLGGFGSLLDEPTFIEYLEGLRVGSPADLAAVGTACWNCGATMIDLHDGSQLVRVGEIDTDGLRPLDTFSAGDVLVPTAPEAWYQQTPYRADTENEELPVTQWRSSRDASTRSTLQIYARPACDADESSCDIPDAGVPIAWPIVGELEAAGVTWGYPNGNPRGFEVAAVAGDYLILVAEFGVASPLLNNSDVVEYLEGLRVASLDELPDQINVVDEFGRPFDRTTGELPTSPDRQAVASAEVRDVTLVLNAQKVDGEICLALDRADTDAEIWSMGCIDQARFDETFVIDTPDLAAGPDFRSLRDDETLEYLLAAYLHAPAAVDVRASFEGITVDGRSADRAEGFEGVFVLMSITEFEPAIDFERGFNPNSIQLEIIDPSD